MNNHPIFTALADEPGNRHDQWLRVQELAQQWRETGQIEYKTEAGELLGKLMAADALIKVKKMRVDALLPARLRRNYQELASDVANSVLSHPKSRATAILENHDPERALMSTMVNFYLHNKLVDHLRAEPVPGVFRTVARSAKARPGAAVDGVTKAADGTVVNSDAAKDEAKDEAKDDYAEPLPDTSAPADEPQQHPQAPRWQPSSMLADDGPGAPPLPQDDCAWDTEHELLHDFTKLELLSQLQQEIVDLALAGVHTQAEAAAELNISLSTYKRRLSEIRFKIESYTRGH